MLCFRDSMFLVSFLHVYFLRLFHVVELSINKLVLFYKKT